VEAESNSITVTRATNTVVFEGKVNGFYRLQPAGQKPRIIRSPATAPSSVT
jgi:hypothetical protein